MEKEVRINIGTPSTFVPPVPTCHTGFDWGWDWTGLEERLWIGTLISLEDRLVN
jgi:hypothetical protein